MRTIGHIGAILALALMLCGAASATDSKQTLILDNFDQLNIRETDSGAVWYGVGNVRMRIDSTRVACDSLIWLRNTDVLHFMGRVKVTDTVQYIEAEQVSYYNKDSVLIGRGDVVMIQYRDSIRTESQQATYDRRDQTMVLEEDPVLYLNYPDEKNMVRITAVQLTFYGDEKQGMAEDSVVIVHQRTRATCGCAELFQRENLLILTEEPHAVRDSSEIDGDLMHVRFAGGELERIDVFDNASAFFLEESDTATGEYSGQSQLSGKDITFYFRDEEIRKIAATGAARSEYYPAEDDTTGSGINLVSGDSIFIYVQNRKISKIDIVGGAEGMYITEKEDAARPDSGSGAIPGDTLAVVADTSVTPAADTGAVLTDTAGASDSLAPAEAFATEDTIHYSGQYLEYFASDRIIRISGNSLVRQGTVALDAEKIDYDIPKRVVVADAGSKQIGDSTVPVPLSLKDGSEEMYGSKLVFNVDTKRGLIEDATTEYEASYYRGRDLYKEEEKVFYVEHGHLTTCDLDQPHWHFKSSRMKLIHNDRVIARPVTFYIDKLPVMTIPYYVFPLKRGRHSGLLPIKLGNFERGSMYIGNLGYYWAASEYWDLQGSLDFYENIGTTINGVFRYNKRYEYSGSIRGTYAREKTEYAFGEDKSRRWTLSGSHNQTLPYDIQLGASGTFVSDKDYYTDYSTNPDERRNRSVTSKANLRKNFGWGSLSLSFNHTNNLDTDSRNSSLPSGSFTMPSFHLFGSGKEVDGKLEKKWYNELRMSYRNGFRIYTDRRKLTDGSKTKKEYGYLDHSMSLSASQKILEYVSISPSMSFQETWYYILDTDQAYAAGIPANRPYRRGAVSAGVSSNTKLYGTFPVNLFGLAALRHVLTPSVGFRWAPYINKNDAVRSYVGVGGGGARQMSMNFGLGHLFQAKVKSGEEEKKLDLLSVSSSLSYNFEATGRKFSDLSTSLRSTLIKNVNLSGNIRHELYDENDELDFWSPRLKSFTISSSFQLRGSVADDYVRRGLESDYEADTLGFPSPPGEGLRSGAGAAGQKTSWNMNFSHSYSETKSMGVTTGRSHWVQFTVDANVTAGWKVKYSQRYDFVNHQSIDKVVDISRNLHCWEGHFYWIPEGSREGFYFKINVIAIPDIKFEKSESGLRGALFNQ